MIIDATNLILGRMASYAAKQALLGESVDIVNAEKAVLTGAKVHTLALYKQRSNRGTPTTGPFVHRTPKGIVKKAIRGMLPYKKSHGKEALDRIKIHKGVPEGMQDKKAETLEMFNLKKLKKLKYISVSEVCQYLGK